MKRFFLFLIVSLFLSCSQKVLHLAEVRPESYKMEASEGVKPDAEIIALIAPYKDKVDVEISEVLGESAITMKKAKPQSTLGNWMADLMYKMSKAYYGQSLDFAFTNYGGIRIPELPKGPITRGKIYELMPFENELVVLKIKGNIVQQLFERMAEDGGWPISKHVRYVIKDGKAIDITINDKAIDPNKTYKIATIDFIANGGGHCSFLKNQTRDNLNILYRNAIMEFIQQIAKEGRLLDAEMDHRLRIMK